MSKISVIKPKMASESKILNKASLIKWGLGVFAALNAVSALSTTPGQGLRFFFPSKSVDTFQEVLKLVNAAAAAAGTKVAIDIVSLRKSPEISAPLFTPDGKKGPNEDELPTLLSIAPEMVSRIPEIESFINTLGADKSITPT